MDNQVLVEVSARHVHVCQKDLDILFGEGYSLTKKKMLSQPGEFACEERVTIVGPKKEMKGVSILGPVRKATQVELSLTDLRSIGITGMVRASGDIDGTPGCKIIGPKGEVEITQGVIAAKRHIHMTPEDAQKFGVTDNQVVQVQLNSEQRSTIFGDVIVRVNPNFFLALHIDTDEGNAAGGSCVTHGTIIK